MKGLARGEAAPLQSCLSIGRRNLEEVPSQIFVPELWNENTRPRIVRRRPNRGGDRVPYGEEKALKLSENGQSIGSDLIDVTGVGWDFKKRISGKRAEKGTGRRGQMIIPDRS